MNLLLRYALFAMLISTGLISGCGLTWPTQSYRSFFLEDVVVTLEETDDKYDIEGPVYLRFGVKNIGNRPVKVSRYESPLEGRVSAAYFDIAQKKDRVKYVGPRYYRTPPGKRDYVVLQPGEKLVKEIDLTEGYAFRKGGKYTIRFEGSPVNRLPDSEELVIKLKD